MKSDATKLFRMFENPVYCIHRIHYVIKEPIFFLPVQLLLPSYIHFPFSPQIPRRASLTQQNKIRKIQLGQYLFLSRPILLLISDLPLSSPS